METMLEQGDGAEPHDFSRSADGRCSLSEVDVSTHHEDLATSRSEVLDEIRGLYHDSGLNDLDFAETYLRQFD